MRFKKKTDARPRQTKVTERESHWRGLLAEFKSSGLSSKQFSDLHGINDGTFQWWRRELALRDKSRDLTTVSRPESKKLFVEFETKRREICIVLGSGASIRVTDDTPLDLLAKILSGLEAQC